jgi:protocatechuate 3,4-dioxygenase beta subunit
VRSTVLATLAALLGLAILLWWLAPGRESSIRAPEARSSELGAADGTLEVPAGDVRSARAPGTARAEVVSAQAPASTPTTTGSLLVAITWAEDGAPAPGIEVSLWSDGPKRDVVDALAMAETADDGRARFDGLVPGEIFVYAARAGSDPVEIVAGRETEVRFAIPSGVDVDGLVEDEEGNPVASADVLVHDTVVTRSDEAGRFFLRDLGSFAEVAAREPRHAPSPAQRVSGPPGSRMSMTLVLPGDGATLAGRVVDADGHGIPRARVTLECEWTYVRLADGSLAREPPPFRATTDDAGRFELSGLAPGRVTGGARASGFANQVVGATLDAAALNELEVKMRREARVVGIVLDSRGDPVAKAWVSGAPASADSRMSSYSMMSSHATSGSDGTFTLDGLTPGEQNLRAGHREKGAAETRLFVEESRETRWEAHLLAGSSLGGTVVDERGAPLADFHVAAVRRGDVGLWLREDHADEQGRFHIDNCPEGEFVLAVRAPSEVGQPVALFDDFLLGQEDLVLRIADADLPTAFVIGVVEVPAETPRERVEISCDFALVYPDAETGVFRLGPLRPGEYVLRFDAPDLGTLRLPPLALAPDETRDVGRIAMQPGGWIIARPRWPEGAAQQQLPFAVLDASGEQVDWIDGSRDGGTSGPLVEGAYLLRCRGHDWTAEDSLVQVRAGERTTVEPELLAATRRLFSFPLPPGGTAKRLHLRVLRADGAALCDWDQEWRASTSTDAFVTGVGGLLLGDYAVEAETDTGLSAKGRFTVVDLEPVEEPLVLPLR